MKNPLKAIYDTKARENKLRHEVALLNNRIEDIEYVHRDIINKHIQKNVRDVGRWKHMYETLADEKHEWSEEARALQDKIDMHEALQSNEKFLGVVRAVKYLANFQIPMTDLQLRKLYNEHKRE